MIKNLRGSQLLFKIDGSSHKIWTFKDILDQSVVMARTLYGAGVKRNDVISILSENRHEYTSISFAALFLNATVAPINVTYTERKIIY